MTVMRRFQFPEIDWQIANGTRNTREIHFYESITMNDYYFLFRQFFIVLTYLLNLERYGSIETTQWYRLTDYTKFTIKFFFFFFIELNLNRATYTYYFDNTFGISSNSFFTFSFCVRLQTDMNITRLFILRKMCSQRVYV